MNTQIVPDTTTCPGCLAEASTPGERCYRYPFVNCTHCGPRFTIIHAAPYDRPFTVMAPFPLCAQYDQGYHDPYDRCFHAQPMTCPAYDPHLEWFCAGERAGKEEALQAAISRLEAGGVVVVKGTGGSHPVCGAQNDSAIALLGLRKHRSAKPLTVILSSDERLPEPARRLLTTPTAPIVLVQKRYVAVLSEGIMPGLTEVDVMLPANPLQHLFLQEMNCPLAMTPGDLSGRPPAIADAQALEDLHDVVDGFLLHSREIVQRMGDSVARGSGEMLRRSRGYVPDAVALPPRFRDVPPVLCLGADLKNTFCLVCGEQAVISQRLGDLSDDGIQQQWRNALRLTQNIYDFIPQRTVHDAHLGYVSGQWASEMELPTETVLHHHAHATAYLAEHG